jgi:hypothetical protein
MHETFVLPTPTATRNATIARQCPTSITNTHSDQLRPPSHLNRSGRGPPWRSSADGARLHQSGKIKELERVSRERRWRLGLVLR